MPIGKNLRPLRETFNVIFSGVGRKAILIQFVLYVWHPNLKFDIKPSLIKES
jgi:hypothetical protein